MSQQSPLEILNFASGIFDACREVCASDVGDEVVDLLSLSVLPFLGLFT